MLANPTEKPFEQSIFEQSETIPSTWIRRANERGNKFHASADPTYLPTTGRIQFQYLTHPEEKRRYLFSLKDGRSFDYPLLRKALMEDAHFTPALFSVVRNERANCFLESELLTAVSDGRRMKGSGEGGKDCKASRTRTHGRGRLHYCLGKSLSFPFSPSFSLLPLSLCDAHRLHNVIV